MSDAAECCSYSLLRFPLDPPQNLEATPGEDSIALTWDAVDDAVSYTVTWEPGGGAESVTDTSYTITGLDQDTTYTIAVVAVPDPDDRHSESRPSVITATTGGQTPQLPTPTGIDASDITDTAATVTWGAVEGSDGYTVTTDPASGGPHTVTDPSVSLTGLSPETDYAVSVVATDSTGAASDSDPGEGSFTTIAADNGNGGEG